MRFNLEMTGGKRALGRGKQQAEWDSESHELCSSLYPTSSRKDSTSQWDMVTFFIPKSRAWTEKDQQGSWETSEEGLLSKGEAWLVGVGAVATKRLQVS